MTFSLSDNLCFAIGIQVWNEKTGLTSAVTDVFHCLSTFFKANFTPTICQLCLTFRKMFSVLVMNGCWVHCYTLDFLTGQRVLMCKFTWQIMKALIFVLVTSTLFLLSPSHLAFLLHLWHFPLHLLLKCLKIYPALSKSHGAAYESVDSFESVVTDSRLVC